MWRGPIAILQYLQCISNGNTAALHWAIDIGFYKHLQAFCHGPSVLKCFQLKLFPVFHVCARQSRVIHTVYIQTKFTIPQCTRPISHNSPVPCPLMHHFVIEMCTCIISVKLAFRLIYSFAIWQTSTRLSNQSDWAILNTNKFLDFARRFTDYWNAPCPQSSVFPSLPFSYFP